MLLKTTQEEQYCGCRENIFGGDQSGGAQQEVMSERQKVRA